MEQSMTPRQAVGALTSERVRKYYPIVDGMPND